MYKFVIVCACVAAAGLSTGCSGSTYASGSPGDQGDPISNEELFGEVRCPLDPDNYIGGAGIDPVCPEFWVCETIPGSENKRCANPGPSYPSDSGSWSCEDDGSQIVCTGGTLPDGGAADGWNCVVAENQTVCTLENPSYPSDGGEDGWSCWYEEFTRYCQENNPDGTAGPGGPGSSDEPAPTNTDGTSDSPNGTESPTGSNGDGGGNDGDGRPDDANDTPLDTEGTSPTFSGECVTYYAAKWDGGGLTCQGVTDGNGIFCLDEYTDGLSNGCGMATVSGSGANVQLTLPGNCQLIQAASKCANACEDTGATGNSATFMPCGQWAISHTEAMWCCS